MASEKSQTNFLAFVEKAMNEALEKAKDPSQSIDILWEGSKITLPADPKKMEIDTAIATLLDRKAADEQEYSLAERIPGMPFDAAHAFMQVLKKRYGWVNAQSQKTFFGKKPPRMQMVRVGPRPEDTVEVPIGKFKLNDIDSEIVTGFAGPAPGSTSKFMDFYISGEVNYRDRAVVMDLIRETRRYLETNSIYQGRALELRADDNGGLAALVEPGFIDLSKVDTEALVLNTNVQRLVDVALMTPIRKTEASRKHKIPLKRGILFYGPYGTGKTLTALVTAKEAVDKGWTFIMVNNATALAEALSFARQFQPAVVFAEDIDRIIDETRSDAANDIINTIDGAVGKDAEVITVLTTNHIERIPAVMLRNGRLDALVPIEKPDAEAAAKLVRYYAGKLLPAKADLTVLGTELEGFIPATIREVVERAKLSMLADDRDKLEAADLSASAFGLRAHADLLKDKAPKRSAEEELGLAFKGLLNGHVDDSEKVTDIHKLVREIHENQ